MTQPPPTPKSWGPSVLPDGRVRFRLWAPAEEKVALVACGWKILMQMGDDGWHTVETSLVQLGDTYHFRLSDGTDIPDPASHAQEDGVDGASILVHHDTHVWCNPDWRGRAWEEAVVYEMHVGTFTPEGTFRAAIDRLPHLYHMGITAIELMPVAHFAGRRGWGYDGVLHYAPHTAYGTPEDLKALIDAAHGHGIMVLLDVVYNHFGPVGNMLPRIAPAFFHPERHTPWGAALAFEREPVRRYFIENALHWLVDYRFDGLRFDATEQVIDDSERHMLIELAEAVRETLPHRPVHLVVEDQASRKSLLNRDGGTVHHYTAGWNDEFHHALHIIATGEGKGHYAPFADNAGTVLREAAAMGFVQADRTQDRIGPAPQDRLPPQVNVNFLHNHDQIGNRAFGERLSVLADPMLLNVMTALLLLAPPIPMLFMGEEYGEQQPFLFFADFEGELAHAVKQGRKAEAKKFGGMPKGKTAKDLPDPGAEDTFQRSKLDWSRLVSPDGRRQADFVRELIRLRREHVVPLLAAPGTARPHILPAEDGIFAVDWHFHTATLGIRANLGKQEKPWPEIGGETIFALSNGAAAGPSISVAIDRSQQ
ncbi:malto-oligosyltrehalose trehalohydrolase [Shinella kummerowiae]|uniref:Malto-oligosyltrehalose trehalohydrolase n=1 Tax=Shinella kummerowiae TaxID=417745 RepID=A0A6N8SDV6_9HYPH|nr:malto-oligosyltrehalose trehalohydrolase [Shinella kummerowiae]MXN47254.1 malto-oligosyltrehalose trehalohydrolase [Shinella kummerowiae]